jgi:hypothetical protein
MSAPCRFLRNKKMFVPRAGEDDAVAPPEGAGADSACHYWCNRTLTEVGLDDRPVHRDVCGPGRVCFEE